MDDDGAVRLVEGPVTAEVVALVPTRGRPGRFANMVHAVRATSGGRVEVVAGVDDDDPTRDEYLALAVSGRMLGLTVHVGRRRSLSSWTNALAAHHAWLAGVRYLVSLGDDHMPRTDDWDLQMAVAIDAMSGPGWAYGDDLFQGERCPTAWMQSVELYRELGWMMLPGCGHMYVDNVVLELGRATGRIAYLPQVVLEHMHPVAGKAEVDRTYAASNHDRQYAADRAAFDVWKTTGLPVHSRIVDATRHTPRRPAW